MATALSPAASGNAGLLADRAARPAGGPIRAGSERPRLVVYDPDGSHPIEGALMIGDHDVLPPDLGQHLDHADHIEVRDPLSFPFEDAPPPFWTTPLLVRLPDINPDDLVSLLDEPLLGKLTVCDLLSASDLLRDALQHRYGFPRSMFVPTVYQPTPRSIVLARRVDNELARRQAMTHGEWPLRTARYKRHLVAVTAEVTRSVDTHVPQPGVKPRVEVHGWGVRRFLPAVWNGLERVCEQRPAARALLGSDYPSRPFSVPLRPANREPLGTDIALGVDHLRLAGSGTAKRAIETLFRSLQSGGRLILVESFDGAVRPEDYIDMLLDASVHRLTLHDNGTTPLRRRWSVAPSRHGDDETRTSCEPGDRHAAPAPFPIGVLIPLPSPSPASTRRYPVYILSNDVVPGMGLTVSAPGLRSRGLALGLRHHGFDVTEIVPDGQVANRWNGDTPTARPPGVVVLASGDIAEFLATRAPALVIAINSNQIDRIPADDRLPVVVDLFAPRILEVACQSHEYPVEEIAAMRSRDIVAMNRGASFLVNGSKKLPFYLAWLLQTNRNPNDVAMEVVQMPMARQFDPDAAESLSNRGDGPVVLVSAGYLQGWSRPGPWYGVVADMAQELNARFNVIIVPRRAGGDGLDDASHELHYFDHPAVTTYGSMLYDDYCRFMQSGDLAVDLFGYSVERSLAMVTRTVGAIAAGLPVVHVPWTETGALVADYDAGWLVDPTDDRALTAVLNEAINDHELREQKAANARRLWSEVFDPAVTTRPLVQQLEQHSRRLDQLLTPVGVG